MPEVAFFYLYDWSKTSKPTLHTFLSITKSLARSANFFVSPDPNSFKHFNMNPTSPTLFVVKNGLGAPIVYPGIHDTSVASKKSIKSWINQNKYPLVPQLESENSEEILAFNGEVVIAIIKPDDGGSTLKELKEAAKSKEKGVFYVWLDGSKWATYVSRVYGYSEKDLPRIVITTPLVKKIFLSIDFYFITNINLF